MSSPPPSLRSEPEVGTTFYLVRHAHAVWQPDEQQPLSARGRADAERVADLLARRGIAAIYASPYPRAAQTVEPLAAYLGLEVQIEADLRERRLSEGRVPDFEAAVEQAWFNPNEALLGGESNRKALERIRALVKRLSRQHPGESVALATHGSLMAILFHDLDESFTLDDWAQMTMPDVFRLGGSRAERLWAS